MYTQKILIFFFSIFILCTPAFATPVPASPPAPDVDHSDSFSLFSVSVDNQPASDDYQFYGRTAIVPSICLPTPATNSLGFKGIYINGFNFQASSDKLIREAYVVVHFSPLMMDNGSLVNNNHYNLNVYEDNVYSDSNGSSWQCQCITSFTQGTLDEGIGYSHSFGPSLNITESECTLVFRFYTSDGFTSTDINFQSYGLYIQPGNSSNKSAILFTFPQSIGQNLDWRLRIDSIDYSLIYAESPDYTDLISAIAGDTSSIESILGQILAQLGSQINAPSDYYQKILNGLFGAEQVTSLNNVLYCLRWIRTRATQIHELMADLANANGSTQVLDYDPISGEEMVREYNNRSWWLQVTDYLRSINIDILQKHKYQQMSTDDGGDEVLSDAYEEASFWDLSSLLGFTSIADFDNDILSHEGESLFSLWFSQNNADAFVSSSSTNSFRSIDVPPSQGEYIDFWAIHSSEISSALGGN